MTESRRKTKILLLEQGKTFADLVTASGLSGATVHNVLDDKVGSVKSKQAIVNALGASVFDGIFPTEFRHRYRAGAIIAFSGNPALAALWAQDFPDSVRLSGEQITFLKDTVFEIRIAP